MLKERLLNLLYPAKCVLCETVLTSEENDFCRQCRTETEEFTRAKRKISFVAGWTALWYYNNNVRKSLLRYKFHNHRSHSQVYGRLLAMKLDSKPLGTYDVLSWVPVSRLRRWSRGFDQAELIARAVGEELGIPAQSVLKKSRHTQQQSSLKDVSHRRANILGAYTVPDPSKIAGKSILLIDDIITTGATASECAKTLLVAGAKEIYCAAVAAPNENKKQG